MKETFFLSNPLTVTATFEGDDFKWERTRPMYRVRLQSGRFSRTVTFWGACVTTNREPSITDMLSAMVSDALLVIHDPSYQDVVDELGEFSKKSYRECCKTRDFFLRAGIDPTTLTDL